MIFFVCIKFYILKAPCEITSRREFVLWYITLSGWLIWISMEFLMTTSLVRRLVQKEYQNLLLYVLWKAWISNHWRMSCESFSIQSQGMFSSNLAVKKLWNTNDSCPALPWWQRSREKHSPEVKSIHFLFTHRALMFKRPQNLLSLDVRVIER